MHIWSWLLFVNIATGAQGLRGQGEFAAVGSQGSSQLSRSVPSIPTLKIQRRLRPVSLLSQTRKSLADYDAQSNVNPYAWNGIEPSYGSSKRRLLPTPVKREAPPAISGAPPTQSLSEPIDDAGGDISYFAEVKLGSSGKPVYLLLDTGASNTWVMDSSCSACTPNHNTFGQADSHTLQSTQTNFDLSYGIGEVSGTVVTDTIALAGLNFTLFFGSADTVSSDFVAHPSDGILGLGQAQTDSTGHPTFMQALSQSKAVSSNLFGINLERASDGTTDGEINFGAPDTSKYTGDINFSDTISDGMLWEINIDDAIVDGVPCNFTGKSAVVDTGTSYALIPPDDAQIIHSLIPGSASNGAGFQVPCGSTTTVQVKIGGITYGIESEDYVGGNPTAGNKLCDSNLVSKNALGSPDKWILGDLFLKNVYSIWNFDNSQIGKHFNHC